MSSQKGDLELVEKLLNTSERAIKFINFFLMHVSDDPNVLSVIREEAERVNKEAEKKEKEMAPRIDPFRAAYRHVFELVDDALSLKSPLNKVIKECRKTIPSY